MDTLEQAMHDKDVILKAYKAWRDADMLAAGHLSEFLVNYANNLVIAAERLQEY